MTALPRPARNSAATFNKTPNVNRDYLENLPW